MEETLKDKAIRGVAWSAVDKVAVRGINFLIGIVIARVLMPSDYGVIGMIAVFITLSNLLIDSGLSQALVQKKNRTQTDMSTAFVFNIAIAAGCYAVLYLAAPCIASFYDMPVLTSVLRVIGVNVIFNSLATVQRANLLIRIDFRTTAIVDVISVVISGVIGIGMAYKGFGVWALVGQTLALQCCTAAMLWLLGGWRPTREFSKSSIRQLWNFGVKLLAAGTVATLTREIYSIVIGKFYKSAELGFYHRAVQTTDMISTTVHEVINTVTFPILSSIQDERERMVSVYSRMLSMTAFCIFPVMTLLAVVASPLVSVLLTDKWLPAVPLIQWLCFARMFTPISSLNMNILNAIGRSDLFLKVDLAKLPLTVLTMAVTLPISVKAVVIGNFVWTFACYFINAYMPGKLFGFGVAAQFRIFYKIVIATAVMAAAAGASMMWTDNAWLKLAVGGSVAAVSYLGASYLMRLPELDEAVAMARKFLKRL